MDFGTIKKKLNQNIYQDVEMFLSDMSQVFINCKLYNGVESPVGKIGVNVRREYDNLLSMYNYVERFQNSQQVHPSLLFIQSLQTKEKQNNQDVSQSQKAVPDYQNEFAYLKSVDNNDKNKSNEHSDISEIKQNIIEPIALPEVKDVDLAEESKYFPIVSNVREAVSELSNQLTVKNHTTQILNQNVTAIVDTIPQTSLMPLQTKDVTTIQQESKLDIEKQDAAISQIQMEKPQVTETIPKTENTANIQIETSQAAQVIEEPVNGMKEINDENILNQNTLVLEEIKKNEQIKQKDKAESKMKSEASGDLDSADSLIDDVSECLSKTEYVVQPSNPIHPT